MKPRDIMLLVKYICPEQARTKRGNLRYLDELGLLARRNRNKPTKAELLIWNEVLRKGKTGYLFLRQKPIGRFILDFYCSKLLLAIEIDGDSHNKRENRDEGRDLYLEQRGVKTIRCTNSDVLGNIERVGTDIRKKIMERKVSLFQREI